MPIKDRINPRFHENLFRPVYEINSSISNFVGAGATLATSLSSFSINGASIGTVSLALTAYLGYRGYQDFKAGQPLLTQQKNIFYNDLTFIDVEELRAKHHGEFFVQGKGQAPSQAQDLICIGTGFEWGVEHANRAEQILGFSSGMTEISLPFYLKRNHKEKMEKTAELGGKAWIQGIGEEKPLNMATQGFYGHTMIMGNVGTGKTTLFILFSLAMIHKGYTVIILDPKNDEAWRNAIQREMKHWGMEDKFHYFHPSKPSTSVKIDPIRNWNRSTEIAERIASIMVEQGKGEDGFVRFNWDVINKTVAGMLFAGIRPQIKSIATYVMHSQKKLVLLCLQKHYENVYGANWRNTKVSDLKNFGETEFEQIFGHYQQVLSETKREDAVDGVIQLLLHDAAHMQKMTSNLLPIFSVLTSKPLDELISPIDDITDEDDRTIVDIESLCEDGGVLYMALDSLSDSKTAGYLSKLVLSDVAAVAGNRYNFSNGKGRRVALFVDEVHAAIAGNDALLNLLAQGRAAWMQMFIATQTKADLEAKTDKATADRILGLCNNFFSLRANDTSTQEYASKQFGEVPISSQQVTIAQSSSNSNDLHDFGSGYSERLSKQKGNSFSESLLGVLPKLQYVARLSDGRVIKARIPIVRESQS